MSDAQNNYYLEMKKIIQTSQSPKKSRGKQADLRDEIYIANLPPECERRYMKDKRWIGIDKPVVQRHPMFEQAGRFEDSDNCPDDPEQQDLEEVVF